MERLNMGECRITDCAATTCKHNKDRMCQLDRVTIDQNAKCNMFEKGSGGHSVYGSNPSGDLPFSPQIKEMLRDSMHMRYGRQNK